MKDRKIGKKNERFLFIIHTLLHNFTYTFEMHWNHDSKSQGNLRD